MFTFNFCLHYSKYYSEHILNIPPKVSLQLKKYIAKTFDILISFPMYSIVIKSF